MNVQAQQFKQLMKLSNQEASKLFDATTCAATGRFQFDFGGLDDLLQDRHKDYDETHSMESIVRKYYGASAVSFLINNM